MADEERGEIGQPVHAKSQVAGVTPWFRQRTRKERDPSARGGHRRQPAPGPSGEDVGELAAKAGNRLGKWKAWSSIPPSHYVKKAKSCWI